METRQGAWDTAQRAQTLGMNPKKERPLGAEMCPYTLVYVLGLNPFLLYIYR